MVSQAMSLFETCLIITKTLEVEKRLSLKTLFYKFICHNQIYASIFVQIPAICYIENWFVKFAWPDGHMDRSISIKKPRYSTNEGPSLTELSVHNAKPSPKSMTMMLNKPSNLWHLNKLIVNWSYVNDGIFLFVVIKILLQ